jgi:protein-L-isoaspartate(D-aspartate) O-methyltransferase
MVDSQLRTSGVNAPWILAAMGALPRENFVAASQVAAAYADRPVAIAADRMLNPPVVAGMMLQAAEPRADDRALLIGAGSGYLAALLANRVGHLVAVEDNESLALIARSNCPDVEIVTGPLAAGHSDAAPYSLIMVDGAIDLVPQALVDQLVDGGRLISGLREGAALRLAVGVKHGPHLALRAFADLEIAMLPGFARPKEFAF